jgi:MFS family permease
MEQKKSKQEISHSFVKTEREEEKIIKHAEEGVLKEKTKKMSIREGIASSVMSGAGNSYITPYALAIGANNTQIGFLSSIPSLLGNLSQLLTAKAIEKYSRKKIIFFGVFLQALMWIPIIVVGYLFFYKHLNHGLSATLLIACYTLFTLFGAFLSPAWNSMMKNVVDKEEGYYFGKRNKINGAVSLVVLLICGFLLNYLTGINLFLGFFILFGISFLAKLVSAFLITKHYDPKLKLEKGYYFSFWQFLKKIPQSNFGKFAVFVSLITLATNIAAPFFTVYMLKNLGFNYATWTWIVISGSLSSFIFMPLWGKFSDKFGNLKVIRMTGAFVFLVPLAWLLTPVIMIINPTAAIIYLIIEEFLTNFIWAGFNLSAVNFIYDAVTQQRLALCIAYYNILNGIGVFIGATLGGIVSSLDFNFLGLNPILFIFLISGIMRLIVYAFMIPKIKEVREVEKYEKGEFKEELEGELKGELKKILLPIHNRFNLVPQGRPVGSAPLTHPGNS